MHDKYLIYILLLNIKYIIYLFDTDKSKTDIEHVVMTYKQAEIVHRGISCVTLPEHALCCCYDERTILQQKFLREGESEKEREERE